MRARDELSKMKRVMIVEDEAVVAKDLTIRLEKMGYGVVGVAGTAGEARELCDRTRPNLLLVDLGLAGEEDGVDFVAHLPDAHDIPVVFLTAYDDEVSVARAQACNPYGYLVKPVRDSIIRTTLSIALHLHTLRRKERREFQLAATFQDLTARIVDLLAGAADLPRAFGEIAAAIRETMRVYAVQLLLKSDLGFPHPSEEGDPPKFLVAKSVRGLQPGCEPCRDDLCLVDPDSICGIVLAGKQTVDHPLLTPGGSFLAKDIQACPDLPRICCIDVEARSIAAVPVAVAGRVIGVLLVCHNEPGEFSRESISRWESLGRKIGVVLADIRTRDVLRRTKRLLDEAERLAGVGGWEWNCNTKTTIWTDECRRLLDLDSCGDPEDPVAASVACYDPEDRPRILAAFTACAKQGQPYDMTLPYTTPKGRRLWLRTSARAVGEPGRVLRVVGQVMDVTEHKRNEQTLRQSAQRFRALVDNIDEYVYLVDYEEGRQTGRYHSPRCRKITGYDPAEFDRDPDLWFRMIHDDDRENVLNYLEDIRNGTPHCPVEHRIIRKDGSTGWILNTCSSVFSDDGTLLQVQGYIINMDNRIRMEHETQEARRIADEANQAKSAFLAALSHEFRTPLNAILGFSQLLAMDGGDSLTAEQQSYVQDINAGGRHLLDMIGDVLDLSKIEAGKIQLEKRRFDTGGMVRTVCGTMQATADTAGVHLVCDMDPDIGSVEADEVRVKQVLYNLLSNAVKFTGRGKTVGIKVRGEGERLVFTVWDEGIGIDAEDHGRIFRPFEQVRQINSAYAGTGLGLSITQQLVELHGGHIGISSEIDRGSTFTVTLPGRRPEQRQDRAPTGRNNRPDAGTYGEILVVEDNLINQKLITALLAACGTTATVVSDGEEAVDLARSRQFDLVLMDINLPGIDGLEAMRRIRHDGENPDSSVARRATERVTRFVAVTAHAMPSDRDAFITAGMEDVLVKPIDLARLRHVLEKFGGPGI